MTPTPQDIDALFEAAARVSEAFRHHGKDPDRIAAVVDEVLQQPGIDEALEISEVLADLAETYSLAGRTDEALATHDRAVAAGWECIPDARMDRARYLIRGGRLAEGRTVHEAVAREFPDDVWFYNAAGLNEVEADDAERAIDWFGRGIDLRPDDPPNRAEGGPERALPLRQRQEVQEMLRHPRRQPTVVG